MIGDIEGVDGGCVDAGGGGGQFTLLPTVVWATRILQPLFFSVSVALRASITSQRVSSTAN